ncbi:MAG: CoA pyrophosphatase [Bacteroidales bacterium]
MALELNKKRLVRLLNGGLPGRNAQELMSPNVRARFTVEDDCREAAVMLLIYPDENKRRMVFIKRNEYRGPHSGQVSFPGGMKEQQDKDHTSTALRETEEETGVPATEIEVLGALTPLIIPVSNFCVYPFIGWMDSLPEFQPDTIEVQYLICPEIRALFDPKNRKTGIFDRGGTTVSTPYIDIDGEMIWGATAMMLSEFTALIGY